MNMTVDKIDVVDDPRVEYRNAYINGKNYGMYRQCRKCIALEILQGPC